LPRLENFAGKLIAEQLPQNSIKKSDTMQPQTNDNAMFIRLEEYKEVLTILTKMKNKVDDAKDLLNKLNDMKAEEDAELDIWDKTLKDIESKISDINKTLFESGRG